MLVEALRGALDRIGHDPAEWRQPVEVMPYGPQGGGFVPDTGPLLNRGSYGQIVEPGGAPEQQAVVSFGG